jgi:hypothetical protein
MVSINLASFRSLAFRAVTAALPLARARARACPVI